MKSLTITQLNLIEKLLGKSTSDNDHEAAAAIRAAHKILKDAGLTWGQLLRKQVGTVSQYTDDGPAGAADDVVAATNAKVQKALDTLRGVDLGKFNDFIASLDKQWSEKKYLSPAQRKPLFEAYEKHKRG